VLARGGLTPRLLSTVLGVSATNKLLRKPLLYLAAFRQGLGLDTTVPDEPIGVPLAHGGVKFIANYDNRLKGPIPVRQALAESRNAVAVWLAREIGVDKVIRTARELGIRTPLQPYVSTALVLLELASAYRAIASGVLAEGGRDFPIPVMGKTGTTSDFRDALFAGSTYGPTGVTVAVRIGFDDNRVLGDDGLIATLPATPLVTVSGALLRRAR
jgi:membrane carboxypeptidase/penicillin-binding protein